MHKMQTVVTDDRGVCLSRSSSRGACSVWGSFGAAFAELLWPLVYKSSICCL